MTKSRMREVIIAASEELYKLGLIDERTLRVFAAPVTDEHVHEQALGVVDQLMRQHASEPDPIPKGAFAVAIDQIASEVHAYECDAFPLSKVTAAQLIEHLMEVRGITFVGIAEAVGLRDSSVAEILTGARNVTPEEAAKFGALFSVDPSRFLEADGQTIQ